jgi:hypothetical protein
VTRKTTAQWRREVPAYDRAVRAVEALRANWAGKGRLPHIVAHIHPDTRIVSIILHGHPGDRDDADRQLERRGYQAGGWAAERGYDHQIWRKSVAR